MWALYHYAKLQKDFLNKAHLQKGDGAENAKKKALMRPRGIGASKRKKDMVVLQNDVESYLTIALKKISSS